MTDEMILKSFQSVGIPKMQTVVYLDLLKNKESTVSQIAKRTRMHRTNVYDILEKLKERNLVFLFNKEGKHIYVALTTDLIINEEKDKLEHLKSAMSYINTTYVSDQIPKIYTLEGLNVVKTILFGLLRKKSTIWIYGIAENENLINLLNNKMMNAFHFERIKRQIKLKLLLYKLPSSEHIIDKIKLTEARLLPKTQQAETSQITQIVCNGSVYITLWIHPIYTIVIENNIISKEYLDFYGILWDCSKECL